MEIVREAGTDFAFASSTVYLTRDPGLDREKIAAAERQVKAWREEKQLPFPDFAPGDKSSFRGSITYPDPDSAVGENSR